MVAHDRVWLCSSQNASGVVTFCVRGRDLWDKRSWRLGKEGEKVKNVERVEKVEGTDSVFL